MTTNQTSRTGPKTIADSRRALELDREQRGQKSDGDRHDDLRQGRSRDLQAFHGRDNADRGGDHAVAEQQSRSQHQRPQQQSHAALLVFMQQAVEREQAALAVVLRTQDENGVFDGDDDGDRPDHQRDAAQHLGRRLRGAGTAEEQRVHGVERRGPDIAVDDAQRADGQRRETAARRMRGRDRQRLGCGWTFVVPA